MHESQSPRYPYWLLAIAVLVALYASTMVSYLLFHSIGELFTIIISASIFLLVWNTRRFWRNDYLLVLGIASLFIAGIDTLHMLSFRGMGVFPGNDPDLPTQLWLAARFLQASAAVVAPFVLGRRRPVSEVVVTAAFAVVTAFLVATIFLGIFPAAFVEGQGLTRFKIAGEYFISALFLTGILLLFRVRKAFDPAIWRVLLFSMLAAIATELVFTLYTQVDDRLNLIGHYLKFVSVYLLYRAIIYTGLVHPYRLLFRDLKHAHDELEQRVEERTSALRQREVALSEANQALEERGQRLEVSHERLQWLSRRLVEVQENERRAIARELHDEAGQSLTSLALSLGALERDHELAPEVVERLHDVKRMVSGVAEDLHRLAVNLRPVSLDRLGLVPALNQYIRTYQRHTGIEIDFAVMGLTDDGTDDGVRLAPEVETTLYRVIQEALTNIARHAKPTQVGVILEKRDGTAIAVIEDDGAGFNVDEAMLRGRLGLMGMRERVETLGGVLTIESAPGSGTTVFAEVPLCAVPPCDSDPGI